MAVGSYIILAVMAYVLGSLPTGFLVGKAKGLDIRTIGSGNIGATNVFRALGTVPGFFVLVVDGLKGFAAATWLAALVAKYAPVPAEQFEYLQIMAGLSALLGHNYTCWLKFKGGKGIATSAGVLAALVPWALLIIAVLWVVLFALTRYVSLGSVCASAALPLATWVTHGSLTLIVVTSIMAALAIYKHRSNIHRLLAGTENRVGFKKQESV